MKEEELTNVVKRLAEEGHVCAVYGHSYEHTGTTYTSIACCDADGELGFVGAEQAERIRSQRQSNAETQRPMKPQEGRGE